MFRWTKRRHLQIAGLGLILAVLAVTGGEIYEHQVHGWQDLGIAAVWEVLLFVGSTSLGILLGVNLARQAGLTRPYLRLVASPASKDGKPRRVLVCTDSLLTAGVSELLMRDPTLDIHRVVPEDEAGLLREISCLRPDALVIDGDTPLTEPANLLGRLAGCPQLRVVIINADHNRVQVCDHASVSDVAIADLVSILRNDQELSFDSDELLETAIAKPRPQLQA